MKFKLLGKSGLRVSELCLGTMTFGEEWGTGANQAESRKIYEAYREAGGNFVDTANRYTEGTSEKFLGEFIHSNSEREKIVLATKYTLYTQKGDINDGGNQRKNMMQSAEQSLKRLRTDYLDVFYVHAWDKVTPIEEVMRGLDDLVRQGKILYIGVSDTPAWVVSRANMMAELRGWSSFIGLQIEYSLVERTVERELLPMAKELGIGVLAWSPLGAGVLTGKYLKDLGSDPRRMQPNSNRLVARNQAIAQVVVEVSKEIGCSASQVALAWLRAQGKSIIPIIGARNLNQFEDNMKCLDCVLTADHLARLDEISRIDVGFPHEFLERDIVKDLIFGGKRGLLEV